jgi:prophage antirepressor-like protein
MFDNKPFRVIGSLDNPQFVVKDICDILGLSNVTQATKSIPKEWLGDFNQIKDASGRIQHMNTVYEPGLYQMIMRSDKEVAKPFQKWVCGEVLTSIRKRGEYVLEEYKQKLEAQQKLIEEQKIAAEEQKEQIELLKLKNCKQPMIHKEKYVVYLVATKEQQEKGIYVAGRSLSLRKRLGCYEKTDFYEVVYFRESLSRNHMILLEKIFLARMEPYRILANRDRFLLPKDMTLSFFKDILDTCANFINDTSSVSQPIIEEDRQKHDKEYYLDNQEYIKRTHKLMYKKHKEFILSKNKKYRILNRHKISFRRKIYRTLNKYAISIKRKNYYNKNKQKIINRVKDYREKNKEKVSETKKKYRELHKEELSLKKKKYRDENKDKLTEVYKNYYKKNKDKVKERVSKYYKDNKEKISIAAKKYIEKNKDKIKEQRKEYSIKNRDKILTKKKEYLQANKEEIYKKKAEKVLCECGSQYSRCAKSSHVKSYKHRNFISLAQTQIAFPIPIKPKNEMDNLKETCICGSVFSTGLTSRNRHIKSQKHQKFVSQQNSTVSSEIII